MNTVLKRFILLCMLSIVLLACEKEITVDLPEAAEQIVVDGTIEQGQAPFVLLSTSRNPFSSNSLAGLEGFFLSGAEVRVSDGTSQITLDEICTGDLPPSLLSAVAEATGFSPEFIQSVDICAYTVLDNSFLGEIGRTYRLEVDYEDKTLTSETKINELVVLDSLWFSIPQGGDSLGFAYARLTDPDTVGNAYRWSAKRINRYPSWSAHAGEVKDPSYIYPLGSTYDDEFFNGLSFEFAYFRGSFINSTKEDDLNEERGFYKVGDTIAVRGSVIDRGVFKFVSAMEDQIGTQGSPFSTPVNLQGNIDGGLGLWAGYGAVYDTIICSP
jgi:hypothetical protein